MKKLALLLTVLVAAACGGDDDEPCDPVGQTGCEAGLVCENVAGQEAEPMCFAPLAVRGMVFDLANDAAVVGARVVALDANGAAVSSVAITATDGSYTLPIPTTRMEDGTPASTLELTLRADAAGYQSFPSGVRQALPIDTATAVAGDDGRIIQNAQTDIGMLALPNGAGTGTIFGTVELPPNGAGVLVVAETTSGADGFVGIANRDGDYRIFNVPSGDLTVTAYAQGSVYTPADVTVSANEVEQDLVLSADSPGAVMGQVSIVNAPGDSQTSVVLVIESTFDDTVARGQTVPGLRAPEPGTAPNIEGAYSITGVPPGKYVVLGAFEEDNLVRDPDETIGGTSILNITVVAGQTTTVDSFKITEALAIISPGALGPEAVTSATPTFTWMDDSSEDEYVVEVFDAFGELVWMTSIAGTSGTNPSVTYAGPALQPGMIYQWRATSLKNSGPLSRTEDLEGVFFLE